MRMTCQHQIQRGIKPPPSAVSFLGPPAENEAPVAEPVPWNAWLRVTVVPEML